MKGKIGGHPVTGRLIIIGVLDILIAVIAIILQSASELTTRIRTL